MGSSDQLYVQVGNFILHSSLSSLLKEGQTFIHFVKREYDLIDLKRSWLLYRAVCHKSLKKGQSLIDLEPQGLSDLGQRGRWEVANWGQVQSRCEGSACTSDSFRHPDGVARHLRA